MDALERGQQHYANTLQHPYRTAWAKGYEAAYIEPEGECPYTGSGANWESAWQDGWRTGVNEYGCGEGQDAPETLSKEEVESIEDDEELEAVPDDLAPAADDLLADAIVSLRLLLDAYTDEEDPDSSLVIEDAERIISGLLPPGYESPPPPMEEDLLPNAILTLQSLLEGYANEDDADSGLVVQAAQQMLDTLMPPGYEPPRPPLPSVLPQIKRKPRVCRKCGVILGINETTCPKCGTFQPPTY